MGYRHYLYIIEKEVVKKLQNKTYEELWEEFTSQHDKDFHYEMEQKYGKEKKYLSIHDIPQKEVFEFGKLYWDDTAKRIYDTGKPLFENEDIQKEFEDEQPYIVTKEALKIAIEIYRNKIIESYEDCFKENVQLCDPFFHIPIKEVPKTIQEKCIEACRDYLNEWKKDWVLNLDLDKKECITNSWYYQYSIFNLVHLYKSIDFDKYDLLFYGW